MITAEEELKIVIRKVLEWELDRNVNSEKQQGHIWKKKSRRENRYRSEVVVFFGKRDSLGLDIVCISRISSAGVKQQHTSCNSLLYCSISGASTGTSAGARAGAATNSRVALLRSM
jgi:hypothetical protein